MIVISKGGSRELNSNNLKFKKKKATLKATMNLTCTTYRVILKAYKNLSNGHQRNEQLN